MVDSPEQTKDELYALLQRMKRAHFETEPPKGITPAECRTIIAIDEMEQRGASTRPGQIASFTHTGPSALSQIFKTLEEKGFIERNRVGADYRGIEVNLTNEGKRFAEEGKRKHSEHIDAIMDYVGEDDMKHFVRILNKIADFHEQTMRPTSSKDGEMSCE